MSKNEKLLIYPFNVEVMPLLRSKKFHEKYEDIVLCSLKGSGFNGKDASVADDGEFIGITIREDFDQCIDECSTILVIESQHININEDELKKRIEIVRNKGKQIIDLRASNENRSEVHKCNSVEEAYNIFGNVKINITKDVTYELSYGELLQCEGLVDITTPVIGVVGTGKNTNKFLTQLSILQELEGLGYKVSWIGSNKMCELIGGHSFPQFMFEDGITDTEKVLLFNRYVKNLEKSENADVILIGVPGGIMPCSKNIIGDFGILSYKVFQGVNPDYLLLSVFYDEYRESFFNEIKMHVRYKFGCNLNTVNICNRRIDWEEVRVLNQNVIPYYTIDSQNISDFIESMKNNTDIELVNIMRKDESRLIVNNIINCLADDEPNLVF